MTAPKLPLELLLMIAHLIRDDHGKLRYGDFNSFLQVNRALYACLNRMLWTEVGEHKIDTQFVFWYSIETNNLATLEFFLGLGADIEVRLPNFNPADDDGYPEPEEFGRTPLLLAADLDNVPMARLLLEKGAKVQYFDRDGRGKFSPMYTARSAEMVQLLLDHDADPELDDELGRRPLHWYVARDDIATMRAILQHGVEVNAIELHKAGVQNLKAVELLVEHGADVKERGYWGHTALHLAANAVGNIDVVKFLVEQWPEGTRKISHHKATPLHCAVKCGPSEVMKFLVEQWPEGVRARDLRWNTPLHHVAAAGRDTDREMVGLFLEGWPEGVREKNLSGNTPLHLAAEMAQIEVLRLMVDLWPEGKKAHNYDGNTPLSMFLSRFESSRRWLRISNDKKEEIIALLGGP
jgi:ankyrin repeat protein